MVCSNTSRVPAERLFYKAGELVSARRNRLKAKHMNTYLILNENTTLCNIRCSFQYLHIRYRIVDILCTCVKISVSYRFGIYCYRSSLVIKASRPTGWNCWCLVSTNLSAYNVLLVALPDQCHIYICGRIFSMNISTAAALLSFAIILRCAGEI